MVSFTGCAAARLALSAAAMKAKVLVIMAPSLVRSMASQRSGDHAPVHEHGALERAAGDERFGVGGVGDQQVGARARAHAVVALDAEQARGSGGDHLEGTAEVVRSQVPG